MNTDEGISFSKEGLGTALTSFQEIESSIVTELDGIISNLEIIDGNWTGPEHDSAKTDKITAEENMNTAKKIIAEMDATLAKIKANAEKISYNG